MFTGAVPVLLLLVIPATAGLPAQCVDISAQCATTPVEMCMDVDFASVTVQIGGPGAEDSNGVDGVYTGTCEGTDAIALVTFKKLPGDQVEITIDNRTCNDNGSLTAMFYNVTQTVTDYTLDNLIVLSGIRDEDWDALYDQTTLLNPAGLKADGFGSFDAVIFNGVAVNPNNGNSSPNGGNKGDIRAGEVFRFTMNVVPGFDLCDFLDEISTPPPGSRNRNIVGRWQACGPEEQNSAFIGPCKPDGELLAVIDDIRLLPGNRTMRVEWSTSLEIQNAGFNVLRREATRGGWERINVNLLPGQGDTVSGADYAFVDDTALNGVEYMYRIEDIDFGGKNDLSEIRKDVTNPPSPQVRLTHPAYGAPVNLGNRPRFAFEDNGSHGRLVMQISADPTFSDGSFVSTHVPGRFGSSDATLNRRTARLVTTMAQANEGIVYWRLVDSSRIPLSDTFRVEIQDGDGSGFARLGVNR